MGTKSLLQFFFPKLCYTQNLVMRKREHIVYIKSKACGLSLGTAKFLPSSLENGVSKMCKCETTFPRVQVIRFSVVVCTYSKEELGNLGITLE